MEELSHDCCSLLLKNTLFDQVCDEQDKEYGKEHVYHALHGGGDLYSSFWFHIVSAIDCMTKVKGDEGKTITKAPFIIATFCVFAQNGY
ncbi:MAG: hypothetical protein KBT08_05545 [Bacteroidales bacterium]|nr:hypothetical protein [Candidatus Cryptobacteroides onthequi]